MLGSKHHNGPSNRKNAVAPRAARLRAAGFKVTINPDGTRTVAHGGR